MIKFWLTVFSFIVFTVAHYSQTNHSLYEKKDNYFAGEAVPKQNAEVFNKHFFFTKDIHAAPSFSSDCKFAVWSEHDTVKNLMMIKYSRITNGKWGKVKIAEFSGEFWDDDPVFVPGKNKIYFSSKRPVPGIEKKEKFYMWTVELNNEVWGLPVCTGLKYKTATVTADEEIYYSHNSPNSFGDFDIYLYSEDSTGTLMPTNAGLKINSRAAEFYPGISPDGKMIVYSTYNRKEGNGLFMSVKDNSGNWQEAVYINTKLGLTNFARYPRFTSDGNYLFFTSDGKVYWSKTETLKKIYFK